MKYVMLINTELKQVQGWTPQQQQQMSKEFVEYTREAVAAGKLLAGDRLKPASEAVRVRTRGGAPAVTDGPFGETKEVLAGYYVMDFAHRDEAVHWAARCPGARYGSIDLRPVHGQQATRPEDPRQSATAGKQRWMFLVVGEEKAVPKFQAAMDQVDAGSDAFFSELSQARIFADGHRMEHEQRAVQVRVRDGQRQVMDGPFAESKEVLGGYFVADLDSRAQAIALATKFPGAVHGTVELRETWPV